MSEHTDVVKIFIETFTREKIEPFLKEVGSSNAFFAAVQATFDEEDKTKDIAANMQMIEFTGKWDVERDNWQKRRAAYQLAFPEWVCIKDSSFRIQK